MRFCWWNLPRAGNLLALKTESDPFNAHIYYVYIYIYIHTYIYIYYIDIHIDTYPCYPSRSWSIPMNSLLTILFLSHLDDIHPYPQAKQLSEADPWHEYEKMGFEPWNQWENMGKYRNICETMGKYQFFLDLLGILIMATLGFFAIEASCLRS